GIGVAKIFRTHHEGAALPSLTIVEVDRAFEELAASTGSGSTTRRAALLKELFARATPAEQGFLVRLIVGELRQGALEGVMVEAVALAAELPVEKVQRALMLTGNLPEVAVTALSKGAPGLDELSVQLFKPVAPMLAQPARDLDDALQRLGEASLEWKLDGARIQLHKKGGEVRVYSRNLNDVSVAVPEVIERAALFPADSLILDGEAIALREDGSPQPFQTTMSRFGRKLDVERQRELLPLSPFFFDCLYLNGESLIDHPQRERFRLLAEHLPAELVVPRLISSDAAQAAGFLEDVLRRGHEGVMAKSLDAAYLAGRRGAGWLKVKPVQTLDLVVLAAEWGHGRRAGWLSNLHLGARDSERGGYVMLGKTFKGMTDAMLAWQTGRLLELEDGRDSYTVYVRPELMVEVAFNDIQASPRYPGGFALRFARVKRYRPDKLPGDADTVATVRRLYELQQKGNG
ncbi:ATP-dependent DNA ligase, partial [Geomonas sp.]|uniref:ATP-dependent DNA ligase n=1 Tax=Geomonas sp. TaxID=2651584 RepID=UPI002B4948C5